ncbi:transglutaminase family protein [Rhodopirellula sp. JC737]|nr:transglutaminase family protein [Rhodopirellula sp. JC737]MCC9657480.1 transglutaminase family protein [Rhodopirellula sp. JC737]
MNRSPHCGGSGRSPVLLGLCIVAGLAGCDFPDRYDIQTFEKPAPWQSETSSTLTSQSRNSARPSTPEQAFDTADLGGGGVNGNSETSRTLSSTTGTSTNNGSPVERDPRLADEWESWQIHSLRSTILGGIHAKSTRDTDDQIRVDLEERGLTYRGMLQILESNQQTFWHDADGNLKKVDCTFRRGPIEFHRNIEVTANEVRFDDDRLITTKRKTLRIDSPLGGPLHVYQTLRRKPLQEGEVRQAKVLLPILGEVANLRLQHNSLASPSVLTREGFQEVVLQEASCLLSLGPERQRESVYWFDDNGDVQLYHVSNEQRFSYGCTETQYELLGREFLQQDAPISLQVPGKPIETEESLLKGDLQQVGYKIVWAKPPAPETVPDPNDADSTSAADKTESENQAFTDQAALAPRQYLQRGKNELQQKLIVSRVAVPKSKLRDRFDQLQTDESPNDLASTSLIDFRSASVRRIANATAGGANFSTAERVMEMNRTVHSLMSFTPLSKGMRAASEIADSSAADSTEQSLLLMALLRSAKIPCRLVLGIRHQGAETISATPDPSLPFQTRRSLPKGNRFVYHAWVMAKADDHWLSLDPVRGGETLPDCLAIEISDMHQVQPIELMEDYISKLSRMQISIYAIVRGV